MAKQIYIYLRKDALDANVDQNILDFLADNYPGYSFLTPESLSQTRNDDLDKTNEETFLISNEEGSKFIILS